MLELKFSKAQITDAARLVELVNSAYRGEASRQGWTTEADLLDGRRTHVGDILDLMADDVSMIMLCKRGRELLGSVHLQQQGERVHIGMLAVSPASQGLGIGKRLLLAAEEEARQTWECNCFAMSVISCRQELIAFYERRGYNRTGISKPFPLNPALWTPKVQDLRLELLEKRL